MWEDIILSIGEAIVSAVGSGWLQKKKREKFANRINTIIEERMLQFADTSLDCNEFYEFVNSRKFKELIRNFFCSTKDGKNNSEYMETIEQYLYDECPGIKHTEARTFIHELQVLYLDFLHKIIEDSPEMSASFQLLTLSHRDILSKMLESEENIMKYFKSLSNTEMKIDDETINSYHDVCEKEFGTIRFTGIAGAENKKSQTIEKFYVKNTFSLYPTKELVNIYKYSIDEIESIQLEDFFDYGSKIVLIGAAGLGKSTTLNYIFCKYEEMYKAFALKIKIDLKEYAHDIGEEKKDLLWCITSEFRKKIKRAKMSFDDTEKLLTTYLEYGKCLIILDALDEIPTQKIRNKVRDEIGNFCEIYYLNRYIISTREAGYLKNRFDDSFLHIKINDFDGKQIQQYSKNWYCSYYEQKDFKEFWEKFSKEVERARCQSLIRNPIVLILALIIFDIEKNLPNKRVEFYKKCIETFLTVREDRKAAYILSEKTKNILGMDSVVPKIAHYKFLKISENVGYRFSYDELKESVFQAIEVEDRINWSDSVKQYSEYLVERTELIRETDEDTLDFAHKTFYEYFLAVYFTKEIENAKLLELLNDWIGDSNYDELARLIVEVIIQNDEPRQHKMVMDYLFEQLIVKEESERISNKLDVFIILADLYNHNMLQPKFHSKYNRVILYNPHYVEQANRVVRHNGRYSPVSVKYESKVIADMSGDNLQETILKGGRGGKGNMNYATSTMQAPQYAQPGQDAQELWVRLELKVIADVGLVGFPNVGKSTFLSRVTNARPKIANYHFTTLNPNLGVVDLDGGKGFVIADIPGLIEGASEGVGLGHQFLRHIERTKVIIHIVDAASTEGRDPIADIKAINKELENYNPKLLERPQVIAANKIDVIYDDGSDPVQAIRDAFEPEGIKVYPISAVTGQGVKELLYAVRTLLDNFKDEPVLFEKEFDYDELMDNPNESFEVSINEDGVYVVNGPKIDKMLGYTNLESEKGFDFFQKFMKRSGVLDELEKLGIEEGDTVIVGDYLEFDYYKA